MTSNDEAVKVTLEQLKEGTVPFDALERAFGPTSLGIIIVEDLAPRFILLREKLLSYASYLANLPASSLDSLTSPEAKYLVGWSHGKETLKEGTFDTLKGSYYVNCAFYKDSSLTAAPASEFPDFPEYTASNIWPSSEELPGFKETFQELCTMVIDVAVLVARACDRYAIVNVENYKRGYLEDMVGSSLTTKARLLHYFPPDVSSSPNTSDNNEEEEDSWCATHVDHGCLTGLTSAIFINESDGVPNPSLPLPTLSTYSSSPDPLAGLYIRSRTGKTTKVSIPSHCLAFQTGEALEKITKGMFRAVPHFVRGPKGENIKGVARNTLAVFTQPNLGDVVDDEKGITFAEFARGVVGRNTVG